MTNESTDLIGFWTSDLLSRFALQSFDARFSVLTKYLKKNINDTELNEKDL